jgi:hypothetical protein
MLRLLRHPAADNAAPGPAPHHPRRGIHPGGRESSAARPRPATGRWRYDLGGGGWGHGELQTYTDSTANVFQDGQSHLLNLAVGGHAGDPPDGTGFPADLMVDFVRVTQPQPARPWPARG